MKDDIEGARSFGKKKNLHKDKTQELHYFMKVLSGEEKRNNFSILYNNTVMPFLLRSFT